MRLVKLAVGNMVINFQMITIREQVVKIWFSMVHVRVRYEVRQNEDRASKLSTFMDRVWKMEMAYKHRL